MIQLSYFTFGCYTYCEFWVLDYWCCLLIFCFSCRPLLMVYLLSRCLNSLIMVYLFFVNRYTIIFHNIFCVNSHHTQFFNILECNHNDQLYKLMGNNKSLLSNCYIQSYIKKTSLTLFALSPKPIMIIRTRNIWKYA